MKRINHAGLVFISVFAVLMYFSNQDKKTVIPVDTEVSSSNIEIVLKDKDDQLIPFTVKSSCSTELECLNDAIRNMSLSHGDYKATLPQNTEIISVTCTDQCVVDFTEQVLEFDPALKSQVEQVLSYLLSDYANKSITVNGNTTAKLVLQDDIMLNKTHFIHSDLHRGTLYQMYMIDETQTGSLILPVVIHSESDNVIAVMEDFYNASYSVLFDTVNFRVIDLVEGEPLQIHLSDECMDNHQFLIDKVYPVLFTLKQYSSTEEVQIIVEDVVVQQVNLKELRINEFMLSE